MSVSAPSPLATPDFSLFTGAMEIDPSQPSDRPIVRMIGSSTERDIQGDVMQYSALQDMSRADLGLSIWLNHDYTLPDSLFGSLVRAPEIKIASGIADIDIAVEVELTNPNAARTFTYIQRGRRLGCSVGCTVEEYELLDKGDPFAGISVTRVRVVEWSVVGIPANQRSWVENAIKGVFARTLDETLAPAVKGLFPREYERIIDGLADEGLRKHYAGIPARPASRTLLWNPIKKTFLLDVSGRRQEIEREAVATTYAQAFNDEVMTRHAAPIHDPVTWANDQDMVGILKTVSGKGDWPLASRDHAWDSGAAEQRLHAWAGYPNNFNRSKYASAHFWYDAEHGDALTAYKLPFCDIADGAVIAVPHALFAVAARLDATAIPDAEKASIRAKLAHYYDRMRATFGDDDLTPPWEENDGADMTVKHKTAEQTGEPPAAPTPDLTKAADVAVGADGSHDPCTGTHVHQHKAYGVQGEDEMHGHEHTHDGDSLHDHHDVATKAAEPEPVAEPTPESDPPAPVATPTPEPTVLVTASADPARLALLAAYNHLGKSLGFHEVNSAGTYGTEDPRVLMKSMSMQEMVTTISQLDHHSDKMAVHVDKLMKSLGIPDYDDPEDEVAGSTNPAHPSDSVPGMTNPLSPSDEATRPYEMAWERILRRALQLEKAGSEFSTSNKAKLQQAHDALAKMMKGEHCKGFLGYPSDADGHAMANTPPDGKGPPPNDGLNQSTDHQPAAMPNQVAYGLEQLANVVDGLIKSLEALNINGLQTDVVKATQQMTTIKGLVTESKTSTIALGDALDALTQRGTGRPTQANTSMQDDPNAAHRDALTTKSLTAGGAPVAPQTLDEALRLTVKEYVSGVGSCRRWPEGVGRDVRPPLSSEQKSLMDIRSILSYVEGNEALVPDI